MKMTFNSGMYLMALFIISVRSENVPVDVCQFPHKCVPFSPSLFLAQCLSPSQNSIEMLCSAFTEHRSNIPSSRG